MKYSLTFLISIISLFGFSQDEIIGKWNTEEDKSIIEIYKKKEVFHAKIFSIKDGLNEDGTAKLDIENPEKNLRNRPLVGLELMANLVYDSEDKEWNKGSIYDPESGNTYNVFLRLQNPNKLFLKGYIGFSWFGRSTIWNRKIE